MAEWWKWGNTCRSRSRHFRICVQLLKVGDIKINQKRENRRLPWNASKTGHRDLPLPWLGLINARSRRAATAPGTKPWPMPGGAPAGGRRAYLPLDVSDLFLVFLWCTTNPEYEPTSEVHVGIIDEGDGHEKKTHKDPAVVNQDVLQPLVFGPRPGDHKGHSQRQNSVHVHHGLACRISEEGGWKLPRSC